VGLIFFIDLELLEYNCSDDIDRNCRGFCGQFRSEGVRYHKRRGTDTQNEELREIVEWLSNGKEFQIKDVERFE
jgi:hypothetical protein